MSEFQGIFSCRDATYQNLSNQNAVVRNMPRVGCCKWMYVVFSKQIMELRGFLSVCFCSVPWQKLEKNNVSPHPDSGWRNPKLLVGHESCDMNVILTDGQCLTHVESLYGFAWTWFPFHPLVNHHLIQMANGAEEPFHSSRLLRHGAQIY